jgi:primosomal protein N' (replication factor Y)
MLSSPSPERLRAWRLYFESALALMDVLDAELEQAVSSLPDSVEGHESATIDVLGPVDTGDGLVRATIRFDYAFGAEVARSLRSSIIRNSTGRTKRQTSKATGTKTSFRPPPVLRVRFDDTEILE